MALEDDIALLSRVPILALMERDALRLMAFSADVRELRAGDVLFHRDDVADSGFVVVRGSLSLRDGEEPVASVGAGYLLGELALMTETRRPVTAVAHEPTTVMRLSRVLFRRTLDEYPQAAARLADEIRRRIVATSDSMAEVKTRMLARDDPGAS